MTVQEIKNRIDSISYFGNRYVKNSSLNICDAILKSQLYTKNQKNTVLNIKTTLEQTKDPWLWNDRPNYVGLIIIFDCLNQLYRILD